MKINSNSDIGEDKGKTLTTSLKAPVNLITANVFSLNSDHEK